MTRAGSVALITGGGSGIGAATAVRLAADGWTVLVTGRRRESLEEVAAAAAPLAGRVRAIPADVTSEDSVAALFETVRAGEQRLDLLFNNAGISAPPMPIDQMPLAVWESVVAVNLTGMFLCARAAFAMMRQQRPRGGRIINNGSLSAITPRPLAVAYNATKHAVTGLTKSLALDGRALDISCCQINIGNAATGMTAAMPAGVLQPDGTLAPEPTVDVAHIAEAVCAMAALPLDTSIYEMTIMASAMPFVGRG